MKYSQSLRFASWALLTGFLLSRADSASACAVCLGASDSPLTAGLNWGIASLMAVIFVVLGGAASFFVYLAKRSASVQAQESKADWAEVEGKVQ
jgi:hypothetical protein